jgi:hypothetical protein
MVKRLADALRADVVYADQLVSGRIARDYLDRRRADAYEPCQESAAFFVRLAVNWRRSDSQFDRARVLARDLCPRRARLDTHSKSYRVHFLIELDHQFF